MSSISADARCGPHHVAFGVDSHYFRGIGVLIASILANNPDVSFVFHVFTFDVSDDNRRRLEQVESRSGMPVQIHVVDPGIFGRYADFPSFAQYSAAIFTRLLIPGMLQGVTDRVLYLDADILCVGDLRELLAMMLDDEIVAVVMDNGPQTVRQQSAALQLKAGHYFNSGVLYIQINNWIANRITEQTLELILEGKHALLYPDQDALNIVLDGRAKLIDTRWNAQCTLANFLKQGNFRMIDSRDSVLIHFTGRVKPWHDWSLHDVREVFVKYQDLSPWAGMPLDMPRSHKEMRMFSGYLFKQGKFLIGVGWYMRYLQEKFLSRRRNKSR